MGAGADFFREQLLKLQRDAQDWLRDDCASVLCFDQWQSPLGVGQTGFAQGGLIEKAGVNVSFIEGKELPPAASLTRPTLQGAPYAVQGLSMIFHPYSPHVPTAHLNIRRFEVTTLKGRHVWFGGGFDFSPYIFQAHKAIRAHTQIASFLATYQDDLYCSWSQQCDEYFYLPHRKEPRGIGGIFFDDFLYNTSEEESIDLMIKQVHLFYQIYREMLLGSSESVTSKQKEFQYWRRGRYVEFNLLYDRGTRFGLESGGRIESILISLPPQVQWLYQGEEYFHIEQQHWWDMIHQTQAAKNQLKEQALKKDQILLDF